MGKLETRIKRTLNAIAVECGDDMWLFSTIITSKPQPRVSEWSEVLSAADVDAAGLKIVGNTKVQARAIAGGLVSVSDDEALEQIADWLDDVLETRVDVLRDKLEQKHEKLGAASPDAPLGRYAFAANRNGMKQRRVPGEPNTSEEDRLHKVLDKFVVRNEPMPEQPAKQLQKLLKRDLYSDVIREPDAQILYRGIALSSVALAKLLKNTMKNITYIPDRGSIQTNVKLRPHKGYASSWTDRKNVAFDYAKNMDDDRCPYAVILQAMQSDNPNCFVVGPNGLYRVAQLDRFHDERESIGIGPITISGITWFEVKPKQ